MLVWYERKGYERKQLIIKMNLFLNANKIVTGINYRETGRQLRNNRNLFLNAIRYLNTQSGIYSFKIYGYRAREPEIKPQETSGNNRKRDKANMCKQELISTKYLDAGKWKAFKWKRDFSIR